MQTSRDFHDKNCKMQLLAEQESCKDIQCCRSQDLGLTDDASDEILEIVYMASDSVNNLVLICNLPFDISQVAEIISHYAVPVVDGGIVAAFRTKSVENTPCNKLVFTLP